MMGNSPLLSVSRSAESLASTVVAVMKKRNNHAAANNTGVLLKPWATAGSTFSINIDRGQSGRRKNNGAPLLFSETVI